MAVYNYAAYKEETKQIIKGKIIADSSIEARENIRKMGMRPLEVVNEINPANKKVAPKVKLNPLKLTEKINFTSTFQTLTQAGIPIIEALIFIENDADKKSVRNVAKGIRAMIFTGCTFAEAISRYPEIFGKIYIGLAKAGEDSGELEKTFNRIIELLEKEQAVRSKVIGALMYPIFVILLAIIAVTIMLTFVFPQFKNIFQNLGTDLPFATQVCINLGEFLKEYWITVPLGFICAGAFIYASIKWPPLKSWFDKVVLQIPILGNLAKFSNFANFMAVMQVSYDAGIPIVDSLYLAILTLSNNTLKTALTKTAVQVQQGTHLSAALKSSGVMPRILLFMIATGEQSGKLGDLLIHTVKMVDDMLNNTIDTMTKMIEPIMLLVIGGLVLFLALALYMPLFASYTTIGG